MSKLSFEALSQRADQIATEELLNSINGGTENDCHPNPILDPIREYEEEKQENAQNAVFEFLDWLLN